MAKVRLILDTRKSAKSSINGLYPVAIRLFHKKAKIIRLPYHCPKSGWDDRYMRMKKSAFKNSHIDCDKANEKIYDQLHIAHKIITDIGDSIDSVDAGTLVQYLRLAWDKKVDTKIRDDVDNGITLGEWGKVIIERKRMSNKPSTAAWYAGAIRTLTKFNKGKDPRLNQITVTFLTDFQIAQEAKGNSKNGVSSYLRAIRAVYNSAIKEDQFCTKKNPFEHYKIPTSRRTKKKAIEKTDFIKIRDVHYTMGSPVWHAKNYALVMFNCRGMNFVDLVKLKMGDIHQDRIFYGRSKTGDQLSVRITEELADILDYYTMGKSKDDYLFPANYDGSTTHYEKYKTLRRRMNGHLKTIARDAGIEGNFTTYTIRHSWATIAKYMGISTEVISEGLGHNSLKTTQIYLRSFTNTVLDEANELVVS
ncbi:MULTISPECIES: site-specific integrase [unclassified Arenibacter]|uniref:tyrosine-type recombinase/integrase n=1 Tax=unclassified Arenibacter TaxID=2615047 RepID=UPI000E34D087|nr:MULTISPECIES: site-specific integrase [unclassified Arenibacter]MCM4164626.1 hypothetical protein [Arenibacter sp. A80]RFT55707.1 hypothetical protein D0S24_13560 [Arenibacter sp. P308M17]